MYEPQEDSLMLKNAIQEHLKRNPAELCIDMGTGTGIQGLAMENFCKKIICADFNQEAVEFVSSIVGKKDDFLVLHSNLFSNLQEFKGKADLISFNPPYLPKEESEIDDMDLTSGTTGIDITLRFLKDSKEFLSEKGKIFFVASSLSNIVEMEAFLSKQGFLFRKVKKERFFFEEILIYEAWLSVSKNK